MPPQVKKKWVIVTRWCVVVIFYICIYDAVWIKFMEILFQPCVRIFYHIVTRVWPSSFWHMFTCNSRTSHLNFDCCSDSNGTKSTYYVQATYNCFEVTKWLLTHDLGLKLTPIKLRTCGTNSGITHSSKLETQVPNA